MNDLAIIRIARIRGIASPRLLRTLAGFGLGVQERTPQSQPRFDQPAVTDIVRTITRARQGQIVLLQGESSCGKSTHLRALHSALVSKRIACRMIDLGRWTRRSEQARTLIDHMPGPHQDALQLLSAVGLGDALVMAQDPDTLSEGQSARLRIARAVATLLTTKVTSPRVLLIDEFASVLDRTSARTLCLTMAKLVRRIRDQTQKRMQQHMLSLVLATAHDDVAAWLDADIIVQFADTWEHGQQPIVHVHHHHTSRIQNSGRAA